jgi:hypothetical protein
MVAAMDRCGDRGGAPCLRNPEGNRQHDRIAVGNHGDAHRILGIVAFRHRQVVRQGGAAEAASNIGHVEHVMADAKPLRAGSRVVELLAVALAVIERDQMNEQAFCRDPVGQGHGIQAAGTDDERSQPSSLF